MAITLTLVPAGIFGWLGSSSQKTPPFSDRFPSAASLKCVYDAAESLGTAFALNADGPYLARQRFAFEKREAIP